MTVCSTKVAYLVLAAQECRTLRDGCLFATKAVPVVCMPMIVANISSWKHKSCMYGHQPTLCC